MHAKSIKVIPLNRVEGDLEIQLELDGDVVSEARSVGTMYRGFENLLRGRGPLDGLVITPRICGICNTAHLKAAAKALDMIFQVQVPDGGKRLRNITLMSEQIQNDMRHSFLLFMTDFTRPVYRNHSLYDEAVRRYQPLRGETVVHIIRQMKRLIEIIAILGGQWPHSSFMVPGGVVSVPGPSDINQCRSLLSNFRRWYERRILGCTLERWNSVTSPEEMDAWLQERPEHENGDLGFFIRFSREAGLHHLGKGHGNFISFGALEMPGHTAVKALTGSDYYFPSGFAVDTSVQPFDQEKVGEDVSFSHLTGYDGLRHPFEGVTTVGVPNPQGEAYSWSKAPRYDGQPAETGPLAEFVIASHPLFVGLLKLQGPNAFIRQLARLVRPTAILDAMDCWLREMVAGRDDFYRDYERRESGRGIGLVQAHRGALGHWVELEKGKIARYQVITPTTWNGSPRDGLGTRGPWEEALVGTGLKNPSEPIEAEHIIRSFDPCLVCCVHVLEGRSQRSTVTL